MVNERLAPALKWCEDNKERLKTAPKWHYQKNQATRDKWNKRIREYRKKSVKNLLTDRIRHLINYSLRRRKVKKAGHLEEILGYSIEQLKERLNKTMPGVYNWSDFLEGRLDIDHIKAIKDFNYNSQDDPEFKDCWALNNLRLLTIHKNRSRKFNKKGI